MRHLILLAAVIVFAASTAFALERETVAAGTDQGKAWVIQEYVLCDGATGGPTKDCAEFDLGAKWGIPDYITFHFILGTTCSGAPTVMPEGLDVAAGITSELLSSPLTLAGTSQAIISPVPNLIIQAAIADGAACTDLEVRMKLFYKK